jgi:putative DNA primase/helicase
MSANPDDLAGIAAGVLSGGRQAKLTVIVRTGERHLAADAGLAALQDCGAPFYQRDKDLVRVLPIKLKLSDGTDVHVPAVVPVTRPMLARALGQSANWRKYNHKHKLVSIEPPMAVADQILGMIGEWPFPPLRGVIATQTMRHDGTLLTRPGYDPATGFVLFEPPPMPPIPDQPSKVDALEALALLNELLSEFVFADDDNVSRSAAISMIMTLVLRGAMDVAPMHAITKPEAGTGGSYLQDLAAAIAIGKRCPVISLTANDEENEKRLAAAALAQQPVVAIDNVSSLLMGDFLCQLIERPDLQCRRLGGSELTNIVNSACVLSNGNNLTIGADAVRRVIQIALDANIENPETRTFTRNPVAEVLADRGRYVHAVLIIARAYRVAGMPDCQPPRPSFERWSDIVRSPLVWLEWPDPVLSVERVRAEDPVRALRAAVFSAWTNELLAGVGYQTGELVKCAEAVQNGEWIRPTLRDALLRVAAPKSGNQIVDPLRLSHWLRKNTNAIAAGHKLLVDHSDQARPRYRLETPYVG